jgi:hypothetical protein
LPLAARCARTFITKSTVFYPLCWGTDRDCWASGSDGKTFWQQRGAGKKKKKKKKALRSFSLSLAAAAAAAAAAMMRPKHSRRHYTALSQVLRENHIRISESTLTRVYTCCCMYHYRMAQNAEANVPKRKRSRSYSSNYARMYIIIRLPCHACVPGCCHAKAAADNAKRQMRKKQERNEKRSHKLRSRGA